MRKPAGGDVPAMYGGMGDPGPAGEESLAPAVESLADRQERRLSEVLVPVWGVDGRDKDCNLPMLSLTIPEDPRRPITSL